MDFEIYPVSDIPMSDVKLLGHDKIVENLVKFLESDKIITPLSIAIHGDWGSGKTGIMQSLSKKLDSSKSDVIFFEAWKYEYSSPAIALVNQIIQQYRKSENADQIKRILELAVYLLGQKLLNIDTKEIIRIFNDKTNDCTVFSYSIKALLDKHLGKKKLVVIIDDLDRCDVENTLQILALMKLFLDVENCICIAAVDLNRLQQAWKQKYGNVENDVEIGYLDKIFQIKINLHTPTNEQIRVLLQELVPGIKEDVLTLFSNLISKNPRAIKRTLNLISYRQLLLSSNHKQLSASLWTILEEILQIKPLITLCNVLSKNGNSLSHLMFTNGQNWTEIKSAIMDKHHLLNSKTIESEKLKFYFETSKKILDTLAIDEKTLNSDFEILYSTTKQD